MKALVKFRLIWLAVISMISVLLFNSCNKEISDDVVETGNYLHVYPSPGNQQCQFLRSTEGNGTLLIATDALVTPGDDEGMTVLRIGETGALQSRYTVTSGSLYFPLCKSLPDGGVIASATGQIGNTCKLDKNGKVEFLTKFTESTIGYRSSAVQTDEEGAYLVGYSNGASSYAPSINRIHGITPTGQNMGYLEINDSVFGFKVLYLCPYYSPNIYDNYCYGWYFPSNFGGNWATRKRIFVARLITIPNVGTTASGIIKFDTLDTKTTQVDVYHCVTSDHSLVLAATQTDEDLRAKLIVVKISVRQQELWRTEVSAGIDGTRAWTINENDDGSLMVMGECLVSGNAQVQPFATKLDRNGNVLWTKVYSMPLAGVLSASVQLPDGSFVFGGNTNGFGKGANGMDVFTLKTDKDGNLK